MSGGNLLMIVGLQMLVGAVALGGISAVTETLSVRWSTSLIAAFAYQIAVPGLAATLLWFALVGRIGTVRASAFHFLNPFFGVLIAAVLLGESIRLLDMLGVVIVMAGILAVQLSRMQVAKA
jgi:drug/metabolite transporter (DMT)-like permease